MLLTEPPESGLSTVEREREVDTEIRVEGGQMLECTRHKQCVRQVLENLPAQKNFSSVQKLLLPFEKDFQRQEKPFDV